MADFVLGCKDKVDAPEGIELPGVPAIRYMRPVVRINGLVQDMPFGATINPCFIKELKDVTITGEIKLDAEALASLAALLLPTLQTLEVGDAFATPLFDALPIN